MTRKLNDIIQESYDIFVLAWERFQADKRYGDTGWHYEWVAKVAEIAQHILINERIDEAKYGPKSDSKPAGASGSQAGDNIVTVRLTDGKTKTIDVKDRLKELGFYWNKPEGSKDWNKRMRYSEWLGLSVMDPFDKLTAKIVE